MRDEAQMWPRASLTTRPGTIETDRIRQLLPIDQVSQLFSGRIGTTLYESAQTQTKAEYPTCRHPVMSTYHHVFMSSCRHDDTSTR
jgi:hypothetical protein